MEIRFLKRNFSLFLISFLFQECTSPLGNSLASIQNKINICSTSAINIDTNELQDEPNQFVLAQLNFPKTIIYLGLKEPLASPKNKLIDKIPSDMVIIPAGNVYIGSEDVANHQSTRFWASLTNFLMDKSPVTVAQFRIFVNKTSYKTEAETFGSAGIINEESNNKWILLDGANWEYPLGKKHPKAPNNHPVTQVSWNDANAYSKWAGKRLPSEIEWEHAARNANNTQTKYSWGNEIQQNGRWNANIWQGKFPLKNFVEDKYAYTSPVGKFGKTSLGLTDMSGNVWGWTSTKKVDYALLFKKEVTMDSISEEYAERGGSFLCEPTWCHGYSLAGRSSSSAETSLFHLGFRCVKDI